MNDLLQTAVKAHGGLDRWKKVKAIKVAASITGAIWFVKSQGDYLKDIVMTVDTTKEQMITDFPGQDKRSIFEPERIVIERNDGTLIEARDNPEASFAGQIRETPWDDFHVAYFQGEALWTYLNTPFLYTRDGFTSEEISPIQVEGETWRRLKVIFPEDIASHTREQTSYFGPDGLLRRHDYAVDVLGGATGAQYIEDYHEHGGILMPHRRRVYPRGPDNRKISEPLLVSIDIRDLHFHA